MFLLMNTVSSIFLTDANVHFRVVAVRGKYARLYQFKLFSPDEQNICDMFDSVF